MARPVKKPDIHGPRYRSCRHEVYNYDFVDKFKKKYPQYKDVHPTELYKIIHTFNELIWRTAINSRDGAELPEGLGYIFIGTCKSPKKENVNFGHAIKTGVRTRHRNFASDNYLAKIFYTNYANKYKFGHSSLWMFKGTRTFKRAVAQAYPENWQNYVKVDDFTNISRIYRRGIIKHILLNKEYDIPETYNEFDLN
jgi:hypothetical protein